ncbi:MAG: hypothetical protein FD165_2706 [Gammaproteobacteria bacterium]|nr:MAG: hypothetical protein FD165_2706 [Gammaproteobacteria bacterium]TND01743.1 MAG: hypothetical protein FD120_2507 [Gammaproteobacteria bacterium]
MWHDLLVALALMLVIEGIFPFANPSAMRRALAEFALINDRGLRLTGLASMVVGVVLLYVVR